MPEPDRSRFGQPRLPRLGEGGFALSRHRSVRRPKLALAGIAAASLLAWAGGAGAAPPFHDPASRSLPGPHQGALGPYGGAATALAVAGTRGVAAVGLRLAALDLTQPLAPEAVAFSAQMDGLTVSLAAGGDKAVAALAGPPRLLAVDLATGVSVTGELDLEGRHPLHGTVVDARGESAWAVAGATLLKYASWTGTVRPTEVVTAVRGTPAVVGDYVYVPRVGGGMAVVSRDDPPQVLAQTEGLELDTVIAGGAAGLVGVARRTEHTTIVLVSLEDPLSPSETGRWQTEPGAQVAATNTRIVAGLLGSGAVHIAAATGADPEPVATLASAGAMAVAATGNAGYVLGLDGLRVLDLAPPAPDAWAAWLSLGAGGVTDLVATDTRIIAAHGSGLVTLDPHSGPTGAVQRPGPIGGLAADVAHGPQRLAKLGPAGVLAASGASGVVNYGVPALGEPTVAAHWPVDLGGAPVRFVAAAGSLAIAAGQSAVVVIDPADGAPISSSDLPGPIQGLAAGPDVVLAAVGRTGVAMARLDGQGSLGSWNSVAGTGPAQDVALDGLLAAAVGPDGLTLIDLSGAGRVIARLELDRADPRRVAVAYGTAVVGTGDGQLLAVDLSAPTMPRVVLWAGLAEAPIDAVAVTPGVAWASLGAAGLIGVPIDGAVPPSATIYLPAARQNRPGDGHLGRPSRLPAP